MRNFLRILALPIALIGLASPSLSVKAEHTGVSSTGAKGAKIYCFMRESGNDHDVSWNAAYAVIKRQSNSLFKTSPTHGAVMIIESVVQNPNEYDDCGNYLGDLFGGENKPSVIDNTENIQENDSFEKPSKSSVKDRYNY